MDDPFVNRDILIPSALSEETEFHMNISNQMTVLSKPALSTLTGGSSPKTLAKETLSQHLLPKILLNKDMRNLISDFQHAKYLWSAMKLTESSWANKSLSA